MPQEQKVKSKEKLVQKQEEKKPEVGALVPSLDDVLTEEPETTQEEPESNIEEMAVKMAMKQLMTKDKKMLKMQEQLLQLLPELKKHGMSDPFLNMLVDSIVKGGADSSELEEMKEFIKQMTMYVVVPEMVADTIRSIRQVKGGGTKDSELVSLLLQKLEERDQKLLEFLNQLRDQKEAEQLNAIKEEFYNALSQVVDSFSKALEEVKAQIAAVSASNNVQPSITGPEDFLNEVEKWSSILEKLGAKVTWPKDLAEQLNKDKELDIKTQIELKKLELEEKKLKAQQEFYNKLAGALGDLFKNPETIKTIISAISSIFRGGPTTTQIANAMHQAASIPTSTITLDKPKTVPSLDQFEG